MFFRDAIRAVPGLLDINMLNCTLYDTANGGDVPECYQYHTVPGQYSGVGRIILNKNLMIILSLL